MSAYAGMDLQQLVTVVKARVGLITIVALLAACLVFVASLSQRERYKATAVLLFGGTPSAEILLEGGTPDGSSAAERAKATNIALASLDSVAERVKRRLGTPAGVEELKRAMDIAARGESDLVDVTAEWDTPNGAALLATTFAEEFVALRRGMAQAEIQRAIDALNQRISTPGQSGAETAALKRRLSQLLLVKAVQTGDVRLAERATPPQHASSPRPLFNAVIAGLVVLVLGLGAVVLLAGLDTRIHGERELTELIPAPVLARIPEVARPRRFIASGTRHQESAFLEAIQFLRVNVQRMRPESQGVVVAVTSPLPGDGKTMVVAWLAQSLAFSEAEVVAVDCDLRNPTLHTYFDARDELGDALPNLRLVPAADSAALPVELAGHEPMWRTFDRLRDQADYVVVDTSPVSSVAHASAVAAVADQVILVVDLERIRRKNLLAALEQLENARARILGVVLNRVAGDVRAYYLREEAIATKSDISSRH
jgi:Mrp family chromosome partitioning ATPase/capsular polysaccharide biosynthesis protein